MRHAVAALCLAFALAAPPLVFAQPGGEKPITLPLGGEELEYQRDERGAGQDGEGGSAI